MIDMATHEARSARWLSKTIGAALVGGAIALAAPAGIAMADPSYGPNDINDPAIADYTSTIRALTEQYTQAAQSGNFNQQQFIDQVTAANNQLRDALLATIPAVATPTVAGR
jgi:hypothetical protein